MKVKTINKLEENSYYQEDYIVDDYLNEFQTLILKTGYVNL